MAEAPCTMWCAFWEQFKEAIHNNSCLTKGKMLHYLRSLLSGVVTSPAGLQAIRDHYDDGVALLSRHFWGTRHTAQEHLAQYAKYCSRFTHEKMCSAMKASGSCAVSHAWTQMMQGEFGGLLYHDDRHPAESTAIRRCTVLQ